MAIEVFNRFEKKYMLDAVTFEKLQNRLPEYMRLDHHNETGNTYTISNLYYDTSDNHLIRTSLAKPKYKEKLRLRAYGVPKADSEVYVEIKKKVAGLVNKRRSALKLQEAKNFFESGIIPEEQGWQNRQVLNEIHYILQTHELYPALYLAYDRLAYFGVDHPDLRVSFDRNIRTRRNDLALDAGEHGVPLLEKDRWIMEIKVVNNIPFWLSRLLSEYKIYPISFSKYGTEYKRTLEDGKTPSLVYNFRTQEAAWSHKVAAYI
ncbi:MAG: polyphosphate polymerase domain-containing protein [Clostridiaceae bacterium]|nr:polyphosphate polymerase domain-containing protein [Clostridiaceae bacterium]